MSYIARCWVFCLLAFAAIATGCTTGRALGVADFSSDTVDKSHDEMVVVFLDQRSALSRGVLVEFSDIPGLKQPSRVLYSLQPVIERMRDQSLVAMTNSIYRLAPGEKFTFWLPKFDRLLNASDIEPPIADQRIFGKPAVLRTMYVNLEKAKYPFPDLFDNADFSKAIIHGARDDARLAELRDRYFQRAVVSGQAGDLGAISNSGSGRDTPHKIEFRAKQ